MENGHSSWGMSLLFFPFCWLTIKATFDPWIGKISWRRERRPTPVFWPGEFHGLYNPWGRKESDTTEWLSLCISSKLYFFHSASVGKEGQDFGQQQFYMLRRLEGTTLSQQQVKSWTDWKINISSWILKRVEDTGKSLLPRPERQKGKFRESWLTWSWD